jgi:hypothetical protein
MVFGLKEPVMRTLPSAHSPRAPVLSGWRRLGVAGAAALLLAGLGVTATAGSAHAAVVISWRCADGLYTNAHDHLTASGCTGSGATDVYVHVSVLDETTGPEDVQATLYCATFESADGSWYGLNCSIYSYD